MSAVPDTVQPHALTKPETYKLPEDIQDGLDDASDDTQLDISDVSKEELLRLHSQTAEQRNSYRRKCVQVGKLKMYKSKHFSDMKSHYSFISK